MTISESKLRAARAATILITIVASLAAAGPAAALPIFAVTAGEAPFVLHFDSATPGTVDGLAPVTGLANGETVVGLDQRPATDAMEVLTKLGAVVRLRVLDPVTGVLGPSVTLAADPADLTNPYANFGAATAFGIDFNPVTDRLRVTTDIDANVRVNPTTGLVTTDTDLATGTDVGVAYTNNFSGAAATSVYAYNWDSDHLVIITPPNNGTIADVGSAGITAAVQQGIGLDFARGSNTVLYGTQRGGVSIAQRFMTLDPNTGQATDAGTIADGTVHVVDVATRQDVVSMLGPIVVRDEGAGSASVVVRRDGPFGTTTVDWTATASSATAADWAGGASGTLTFAPGETVKEIPLTIVDDAVDEQPESFIVTLTGAGASPDGGRGLVTAASQTIVSIADNDAPPAPPAPVTPPVVTPPVVTPPDTTRPLVLLAPAASIRLASLVKFGLVAPYSTSEASSGTLVLRLGTKVLGSTTVARTGAAVATGKVRLTKAGAKLLVASKARSFKAVLALTLRDAAGNTTTVKHAVLVVR